jgi:fibronectin type 3 domain-containing protein
VVLSWSAPASDGGAAITGYNIYRGTAPGGESATPIASNVAVTGFTDTGLTNGTTYYYTVAAVNSVGTSAPSNETFATPTGVQATVPSAPQGLAATGGNASVKLTWTAPASNGGSAITGYNIYRGTTPGGESATPVAAGVAGTSFTDPTASNGTTYYYIVAAVNAIGTSAPSGEASATPNATVPSAPSGLVASGGSGQVVLSWSAPASDGGAAITGYNIYRGTTPGGESATPVATGVNLTSFTDTGVTNGTTYYYTVAAVNAVGISAPSSEASATPKAAATVPSAPQGLTATGGNASVKLTWTAPASDGGAAITGYNIYRGTAPGGESATPVASNVSGTSFTDTGLTNGTTYYYTVTAVNAVGPSAPSGEASAAAQATVPTAPLGVVAAAGNTSVGLSWSVPASNGGSPVTGYNIYRGTTPGGESATPLTTGITGTSFTDTGLTNGTTYYYTVAAVNAAGTSPPSAEASATPQAPASAAYIRRVGSATSSTAKTTITIPVGTPGVTAGHTLVISMLLSSTSTTAAITAKDTAGNTYTLARDTNDGSAGDRSVIAVATSVTAIAAGGSITLTYSSAAETHITVDEFSGITAIDTAAGATGTTAAFSSGNTPATSQASELLIGSLGTESGTAPAWTAGWTALPALNVSGDMLGTAYKFVTTTGTYAATGTTSGQWMASIITLKTG